MLLYSCRFSRRITTGAELTCLPHWAARKSFSIQATIRSSSSSDGWGSSAGGMMRPWTASRTRSQVWPSLTAAS